ncbi:MAG: NUDIX hydrolase [Acidimicrobiia bacterium]
MTGRHAMFDGAREVTVSVPTSGGENVMVPVVRAIVRSPEHPDCIVLQRRDNASESVIGLLEIPGGRWKSGESPIDAISREVLEETGLDVTDVAGVSIKELDGRRSIATIRPLAIVSGVQGAFPAAHTVLLVDAEGSVRPAPGETSDVRWWHVDEVRTVLSDRRDEFVPSTVAALEAYMDWLGSTVS